MGSSLFSATVTLGTLGANNLGKVGELQDQLKEQQGQLGELQDIQGKVQDQMSIKGQNNESKELEDKAKPPRDPQADARIKEMQEGRIAPNDTQIQSTSKELHENYGNEDRIKANRNNDAIAAAGNTELTAIKGKTDDQIKNKHSEIEATNGELQRKSNQNRMISEIVDQAGKSGFDAGKSIATEQAAHARAAGQAAQYEEKTITEAA